MKNNDITFILESLNKVCCSPPSPRTYVNAPTLVMSGIFTNGQTLVVSAVGPGKLHLLSYESNAKIQNHVGYIPTNKTGETRFVISHSYTFTKFAFFWEGSGEAVYGVGTSLVRQPVGKSWTSASLASWGNPNITTANVTSQVTSAVTRDNQITAFIIPDLI